jgi:hypothetical protein
MDLDIDVSGEDIFQKDFVICVANKDRIIKGFKFTPDLIGIINSRYGQGIYKYRKSKKGVATFKVRVYCIVVSYLIKSIKINSKIFLNICRDFDGKENDIKSNFSFLLKDRMNNGDIKFTKLTKESNAHKYAYLMRKDTKNKLDTYVNISLNEIEKYLK